MGEKPKKLALFVASSYNLLGYKQYK